MAQFKAFDPAVEVNGAAVSSVLKGMEDFRVLAEKILAEHGINRVATDQWYPQQAWLDSFEKISNKVGKKTLKIIGQKIPETALWPSSVHTIEEALASIDAAYHMNHRNGEIGHYLFIKTGTDTGKVVCSNPYPCVFDLGVVEATAKKFSPEGKTITVTHDETNPCRQSGGENCTYIVSWK